MTDTTPAAIEALTEWATNGPWWHDNNEGYGANNIWANVSSDDKGKELVATIVGDCAEAEANARFIAAARDLVPALAAERDAALTEAAALRKEVERLRGAMAPFDRMAGAMFARNWNKDGVAISFVERDGPIRLTFADFLAVRAALTAEPLGHGVTADDFPCPVCGDADPVSQSNCAMNGCSAADDFGGEA